LLFRSKTNEGGVVAKETAAAAASRSDRFTLPAAKLQLGRCRPGVRESLAAGVVVSVVVSASAFVRALGSAWLASERARAGGISPALQLM